jgi:hypothetical protein
MEKGYMILSRIGVRPFNKNSREEKPEYTLFVANNNNASGSHQKPKICTENVELVSIQ